MKTRLSILFAVLASCATPQVADPDVWIQTSPDYGAAGLNNIAVLEVQDPTGQAGHLRGLMREEVRVQLRDRLYAPTGLTYVDAHLRNGSKPAGGLSIVDAAHLKTLAAPACEQEIDGIFALQIQTWDESSLLVNNRVRYDVRVALYGAKGQKLLWHGGMRGEVDAGGLGPAPRDRRLRQEAAARAFVKDLVLKLPKRI